MTDRRGSQLSESRLNESRMRGSQLSERRHNECRLIGSRLTGIHRNRFLYRGRFILLLFLLLIFIPHPVQAAEDEEISFSVNVDRDGKEIYEVQASLISKNTYYLFLPSSADLRNLTVHYTGRVTAVSIGQLDTEAKTISGDFSGAACTVTFKDKSRVTLICMQSSLPSMWVTLGDASLQNVHDEQDTIFTGVSAALVDPANADHNFEENGTAQFKGRGNSSWYYYDKRSYQIRFEEKVSVLGMPKARKWVLLANASDPSLMRNKLVFEPAAQLGFAFVPKGEYADLWIDGDYRGTYLVTEKPEVNKNRLKLDSGHGIICELDDAFYKDEELYYEDVNEVHFTLKDSEAVDGKADFEAFEEKENAFAKALMDGADWSEIVRLIDPESFALMYLVNEYYANNESATTSFYWYMDGPEDVLHAGPVWDFDTCMRNGNVSTSTYYVFQNFFYRALLNYPEFREIVQGYYNEFKPVFATSAATTDLLYNQINASAGMNYVRFGGLGEMDAKDTVFAATYEENVRDQQQWLKDRNTNFSLDQVFIRVKEYIAKASVASDGSSVTLKFLTLSQSVSSVTFYVYGENEDPENALAFEGERQADRSFTVKVPYAELDGLGTYHLAAYINGSRNYPDAETDFTLTKYPKGTFVSEGVDYMHVFDPQYYYDHYADARSKCGKDARKLFEHFLKVGIPEGRMGSAEFDVIFYMKDNKELYEEYGEDYASYYVHYETEGREEGRAGAEEYVSAE